MFWKKGKNVSRLIELRELLFEILCYTLSSLSLNSFLDLTPNLYNPQKVLLTWIKYLFQLSQTGVLRNNKFFRHNRLLLLFLFSLFLRLSLLFLPFCLFDFLDNNIKHVICTLLFIRIFVIGVILKFVVFSDIFPVLDSFFLKPKFELFFVKGFGDWGSIPAN